MSHRFQVNLGGIISLLSNHLYSGPEVFIREILQNGVDGIRARENLTNGVAFEPRIDLELEGHGAQPTLIFSDTGIGLTHDEIHRFLATIGESSKRDDLGKGRSDFIGQFGIGLLSCFLVADEIVLITQTAKGQAEAGEEAIEWVGRPDGTYSVRGLGKKLAVGTRVYLRCKPGMEDFFTPEKLRDLVLHYGGLLPYPIYLKAASGLPVQLNAESAPWRQKHASVEARRAANLAYGRRVFGGDFFDAIELKSSVGDVEGVAFVLPHAPSVHAKSRHRIYLKNMLLSESGEGILPEWAFFVRAVVNANSLRPNAAREAFYEDAALEAARENLGGSIAAHLKRMAKEEPERLVRFVALHHLSICALATQDEEFLRMVVDLLPFETSKGRMTLGEYRAENRVVRYVATTDQFRQIASVAAAQDMCLINAGHAYEEELLQKLGEVFPETPVEAVDAESISQGFTELDAAETNACFDLLRTADKVLREYGVLAEAGRFLPAELAALYTVNQEGQYWRSVEKAEEVAPGVWGDVLGELRGGKQSGSLHARLMFNYDNPLIRRLTKLKNRDALKRCVEMLYVQALLMGHFPLSSRESALLNSGLIAMVDALAESKGDEA